jgi:hypothetical protein
MPASADAAPLPNRNRDAIVAPLSDPRNLAACWDCPDTLSFMDAFAERFLPVEGLRFLSRSGTWLCELNAPVDVSGVDRRIFKLIEADPRGKGPAAQTRKLELRTSLASFVHDEPDLDIRGVAAILDGYSVSDIKMLVEESARAACEVAADFDTRPAWMLCDGFRRRLPGRMKRGS